MIESIVYAVMPSGCPGQPHEGQMHTHVLQHSLLPTTRHEAGQPAGQPVEAPLTSGKSGLPPHF